MGARSLALCSCLSGTPPMPCPGGEVLSQSHLAGSGRRVPRATSWHGANSEDTGMWALHVSCLAAELIALLMPSGAHTAGQAGAPVRAMAAGSWGWGLGDGAGAILGGPPLYGAIISAQPQMGRASNGHWVAHNAIHLGRAEMLHGGHYAWTGY